MALPTTSLSFSALQTEYGGSNPISLSEYYLGGSNVPAGQTSGFGTIPTSGAISVGVFRGTTKVSPVGLTTSLTDGSVQDGNYRIKGFLASPTNDALFPSPVGSVTNNVINLSGGGTTTFRGFFWRQVPFKSGSITTSIFKVSGNHPSAFTNINYGGVNYSLSGGGTYNSEIDCTEWLLGFGENIFTGTTRIFTLT
jgi:hypothetical protein